MAAEIWCGHHRIAALSMNSSYRILGLITCEACHSGEGHRSIPWWETVLQERTSRVKEGRARNCDYIVT